MSTSLELVNELIDRVTSVLNGGQQRMTTRYMISSQNPEDQMGPKAIYYNMKYESELIETANRISTRGKGILASDESASNIAGKFKSINIESTEENRRKYRQILYTTKDLNKYISGVIMNMETIEHTSDDNVPFPQLLTKLGIVSGIKLDMGTIPLPGYPKDRYTQGLTNLYVKAPKYYKLGARFAKWRCVIRIQDGYVSQASIEENAWTLARYARICQEYGLVPIVEPEVLMDGNHNIEICQYWTEKVINATYKAMIDHEVLLEGSLLKCNMVLNGNGYKGNRNVKENAQRTITALRRSCPSVVPGINFLSGGQSEEEATINLNEMNKLYTNLPWNISFSYGRALQRSCLDAWLGKDENIQKAQQALLVRARANSMAQRGTYDGFACTEKAKKTLFVQGYKY